MEPNDPHVLGTPLTHALGEKLFSNNKLLVMCLQEASRGGRPGSGLTQRACRYLKFVPGHPGYLAAHGLDHRLDEFSELRCDDATSQACS